MSSPPNDRVPEGERLGNLWATHIGGARWHRLTEFRADGDRWVTVRTPVVRGHGIDFVRVAGRGSATRPPRFELWRFERGAARRVSSLDGERYLAGLLGERLVWNVPDPLRGRQMLAVEGRTGLRTIGCGAVAADPLDVVDPDRRPGRGIHVPARGDWPELEASSDGHGEEIAVIVGDFAVATEAEGIATAIRAEFPGRRSRWSTPRPHRWRSDPACSAPCCTCRTTPTRPRPSRTSGGCFPSTPRAVGS